MSCDKYRIYHQIVSTSTHNFIFGQFQTVQHHKQILITVNSFKVIHTPVSVVIMNNDNQLIRIIDQTL